MPSPVLDVQVQVVERAVAVGTVHAALQDAVAGLVGLLPSRTRATRGRAVAAGRRAPPAAAVRGPELEGDAAGAGVIAQLLARADSLPRQPHDVIADDALLGIVGVCSRRGRAVLPVALAVDMPAIGTHFGGAPLLARYVVHTRARIVRFLQAGYIICIFEGENTLAQAGGMG